MGISYVKFGRLLISTDFWNIYPSEVLNKNMFCYISIQHTKQAEIKLVAIILFSNLISLLSSNSNLC